MPSFTTPKPSHFTAFRSAAEELAQVSAEHESVNEGGHIHAKSGSIVQTPNAALPYKVVFDHEDGPNTEQPCATMREGEEIKRRNTPTPPSRSKLLDREASVSMSPDEPQAGEAARPQRFVEDNPPMEAFAYGKSQRCSADCGS